MFEIRTETAHRCSSLPVFARSAALEAITAHKSGMRLVYVAKAWNIDPIRSVADLHAILMSGDDSRRSSVHDMVHQVMTEFTTRVCESSGELRRG